LFAFTCKFTAINICFIGKGNKVYEALKKNEEELVQIFAAFEEEYAGEFDDFDGELYLDEISDYLDGVSGFLNGDEDFDELDEFDEKFFDEMISLGINADKMYGLLSENISKRDLLPYQFPSKETLKKAGVRAIYLGNYIKWHTKNQVEIIKKELSWQGQVVEGIPPVYDYEKIECRWQGVRDYCKFIKRGHGRTNHLVCIDIRNGELDRDKGLELVNKYDGKRPASLDDFLEFLGIDEDEFEKILLGNCVADWGFDRNGLSAGTPLPDMKSWDNLL